MRFCFRQGFANLQESRACFPSRKHVPENQFGNIFSSLQPDALVKSYLLTSAFHELQTETSPMSAVRDSVIGFLKSLPDF